MPTKWIEAYDTRTGDKLPYRVPETYPDLFQNISATPKSKARKSRTSEPNTAAKPPVEEKE